ncbi:hypothetical protein FGIG_12080 [Fasciola gigantica]|uniref:Uncharacterized protein n=1 Tax=Fasciola gigantica TaxID=46835 RepID=A0A504Y1K9_FASGI|nr:hypothetical protein FGIG_12080 [Fasciola gigantica]
MKLYTCALFTIILVGLFIEGHAQQQQGYQLEPLTSYIILAPNRIRANELVQVTVSIFRLLYEQLTIRLSIKINNDEIISAVEIFKSPGTRIMQLKVIQYEITIIYTFFLPGIIELDFPLSDIVQEGDWTIRAQHERFASERKFKVVEYWRPLWDVNVTLPLRIMDNELALYGLVMANYTSGKAVNGNATALIQVREAGSKRWTSPPRAQLTRELLALEGFGTVLITLEELRLAIAGGSGTVTSLANTEVWINVTYYSWWEKASRQGWAYTQIFSSNPLIKFLGGLVRPFKPNLYFTAYLVVYMPDGSMVRFTGNRRVSLSFYCNENTFINDVSLVVPDDGLIVYTYRPSGENCIIYRLQAHYLDETSRVLSSAEQRIFRFHSYSNTFLQLSTSTLQARVSLVEKLGVLTQYDIMCVLFINQVFLTVQWSDDGNHKL